MLIYKGTTNQFKEDVLNNQLADLLASVFKEHYGRDVLPNEYQSWSNSCQHIKNIIDIAKLNDNMIALEYEVPYNTNRIDCMLFGKGEDEKAYAVLIELKQWSTVEELDEEGNFIETFTGSAQRRVAHPSQQVEGYHNHLINFVQVFEIDSDYDLYSCAYCHNYEKESGEGLFAERYKKIVDQFPVYTKDDVQVLAVKLKSLLSKGDGFEIFNRFMTSPVRPAKKLLESVSKIIKENKVVFSLLHEQLVAKNLIMSKVNMAQKNNEKSVIIVHGGPGTGKTVVALNILAELAAKDKVVFYGCKSKPFREALQKMVGSKAKLLFSNLSRFIPSKVKENKIDVVLIDEAHRIEKNSNSQYTKKEDRTDMPQVEQLVRCAKTSVFFIDDKQSVRSQEVGASKLIQSISQEYGYSFDQVELVSQFRCAGSDNYLDWLESALGYTQQQVKLMKDDPFEFKIFDDPEKLFNVLNATEKEKPNSARMVAGYCWPWSNPNKDGTLVDDVVIGNFKMPWEARDGFKLEKGIPKWFQWAFKTEGINQVGCIYTAQGFEFDYIGVIISHDLYVDDSGQLKANFEATCDSTLKKKRDDFEKYVKNIYRVLMTRGMKGCYVYFCDKKVEQYFRDRIDGNPEYDKELTIGSILSLEIIIQNDVEDRLKYFEYLPVYSLEAACGTFGNGILAENEGWIKVDNIRLGRNMFVSRVHGKSMEPLIKDGSYCVFRTPVVGSRNNKIVLIQHNSIHDPESGGSYTVKQYSSKKQFDEDGTWVHEEILLIPLNKEYDLIKIPSTEDGEFIVIGEFVKVLGKSLGNKI
tara:strand:+ start:2981 stop:5401 length:2421 start_codon:yes stop_codon:yes gene_type:complete